MPRLGVSYQPIESLNLRGGVGLYSGGSPSVWVSNNYSTTARGSRRVLERPDADQRLQRPRYPAGLKDMIRAGNGNTDALDPDSRSRRRGRSARGADYSLDIPGFDEPGKNLELKANYTYTKTFYGVQWLDLRRDLDSLPNNVPIGTLPDGRPLYDTSMTGFNASRGYDMFLTNTRQGYGHAASLVIEKGFPFGLYVAGSYAYQAVYEVNPATARARSATTRSSRSPTRTTRSSRSRTTNAASPDCDDRILASRCSACCPMRS